MGDHSIVFYADDSHTSGQNPIWEHMILTAAVRMFERVGLQMNLSSTKSMVCTP